MRSKDSFRVAFFLRRNVLKNGESPVFMRITVNGQRAENNIQKSILSNLWNQAKERATGTSRTANDLNKFIEEARIKVHAIVTELQQENEPVTAIVVQQRFYGINPKKKKGVSGFFRWAGESIKSIVLSLHNETRSTAQSHPTRSPDRQLRY